MLQIVKQTFTEFSKDKCTRMAAALAYYTTFSLAPLMMLIVMIAGFIWDPSDIQGLLESEIKGVVGQDGADQVKTMLSASSESKGGTFASILSTVLLVVGATGLVGQLQAAMNDAWEVKPDPEQGGIRNFITKRILSLGMICGIAFLLLVSLAATSILSAAGNTIGSWLPAGMSKAVLLTINVALSLVVISVMFAAMFKFLPDAKVAWKDVAVGAMLTAVLFVIGKYAMGAYLGSKNMNSTYDAAGSLALILLWIYYSSMIFLFGAEFTQVWAKVKGIGVVPDKGAVRVVEKSVRVEADTDDSSTRRHSEPKSEELATTS